METEILFRGKEKNHGEWVEGQYHYSERYGCHYIHVAKKTSEHEFIDRDIEIDSKTIGQLIRREKDRAFFVGDKLEFWSDNAGSYEDALREDELQECELLPNGVIHGDFGDWNMWSLEWAMDAEYQFKIAGNIHDEES